MSIDSNDIPNSTSVNLRRTTGAITNIGPGLPDVPTANEGVTEPEREGNGEQTPEPGIDKEIAESDDRQATIDRLAQETLRGLHGVGNRRRESLGEFYDDVIQQVRLIRQQGGK